MTNLSVTIDACPVDAVLANDVIDESGMVILKSGTVLTKNKITSLEKHGLKSVVIQQEPTFSPEEIEKKKKTIEARINKRLRKCEVSSEMKQLVVILVNHHCRDI